MTQSQDPRPVTQEDREAAEDAYYSCFEIEPNRAWLDAMLTGSHDGDPVVQAFARHRITALSRQEASGAVWEALHNLIVMARPFMTDQTQRLALRLAEEALAALSAQPLADANVERERVGFRAIEPTSAAHAAVLEDLARRIDDE